MSEKEKAIDQIRSSIRWFIKRGSSLEGYLKFYKDSHYPPKQIAEIFEADKQSNEIELKRFKNLTGRDYEDDKIYFTQHSLFMNQAPSFNFELDEDQLLKKALESGFVTKAGEDKYLMNDNY